jgi:hypothetical protein
MVFKPALSVFTVAANIAFPLRIARVPKEERERRVHEVATCSASPVPRRKPGSRAGSESRWAARSFVSEVFLMDSRLEASTRAMMSRRVDFAAKARLGATTVSTPTVEAPVPRRRTSGCRLQQFDRGNSASGEHLRRGVHRLPRRTGLSSLSTARRSRAVSTRGARRVRNGHSS